MDREITHKNRINQKILIGIIAGIVLITLFLLSVTHRKTASVEKEYVTIKTVEKGLFEDMLILNTKVAPLHSLLINVTESGAIHQIFVENGSMVKEGQPLLEVYNPSSELNYLQQETGIIEQINNLRNIKINLRNQELELDRQRIQIEHDYADALAVYKTDTALYHKELIPKNQYDKTVENLRFQTERKNIIQTSVTKEQEARAIQITGLNQSLAQMQESLNRLRSNKDNFTIKALASGRLSSFDPILGQNLQSGVSIGKIDILEGYKLETQVDEFYFFKIKQGLEGQITAGDKIYSVVVSKVLPEITGGQFKIELLFQNETPENLHMGMTYSVKLFLSEDKESLMIPKGKFYSETGGNWIFVLTSSRKAEKRKIELGRENPLYYEVNEGLKEGEQVITSDYKDFKNNEVLKLK